MKLSRRTFLKFLAGGSAGLFLTPLPFKGLAKLAQITEPPNAVKSGNESFVHTISMLCPSSSPIKVRLLDGQPVQATPWEGHPLAGRGISCLAAAEVQNSFRPSRLRQPLLRQNNEFVPLSWRSAISLLEKNFNLAGPSVACIVENPFSVSSLALRAFTGRIKGSFFSMPSESLAVIAAAHLMGITAQAGFDIENSDFVFCVGADVLESWGLPLHNRKVLLAEGLWGSSKRQPDKKLLFCGPLQNTTALLADEWAYIKPGAEESLLLCLARLIMDTLHGGVPAAMRGIKGVAHDIKDFYALTNNFTVAYASSQTGMEEGQIRGIAASLIKAKNPLVIVSTRTGGGGNTTLPMLGLILNIILGNLNKAGGLQLIPLPFDEYFKGEGAEHNLAHSTDHSVNQSMGQSMDQTLGQTTASTSGHALKKAYETSIANSANAFFAAIHKGQTPIPHLAIFNECNPLYSLPQNIYADMTPTSYLKQSFAKIPFKVFVGSFFNETAAACDLILPVPTPLERFEHTYSPFSFNEVFYSINKPVFSEKGEFSSLCEILQEMAGSLGLRQHADEFTETAIFKKVCSNIGANYAEVLRGKFFTSTQKAVLPASFNFRTSLLKGATQTNPPKPAEGELLLLSMPKLILENSSLGLPLYATATAVANDFDGRMSMIFVNRQTAEEMKLANNEEVIISLKGETGSPPLKCRLKMSDRVPPKAAAMFRGYGHENMDAFSDNKGQNIMLLLGIKNEFEGITGFCEIPIIEIAKAQG